MASAYPQDVNRAPDGGPGVRLDDPMSLETRSPVSWPPARAEGWLDEDPFTQEGPLLPPTEEVLRADAEEDAEIDAAAAREIALLSEESVAMARPSLVRTGGLRAVLLALCVGGLAGLALEALLPEQLPAPAVARTTR